MSEQAENLEALEARFAEGVTVPEVVRAFTDRGEKISEATFRKYVQLGLLPHSVRVRRKGSGRGSQGIYPSSVFRRIYEIRFLMSRGLTMDEIQREHLSIRTEVEALEQQLGRVNAALTEVLNLRKISAGSDPLLHRAIEDLQELGADLIRRLKSVEGRLSARARMARAAV